MVRNFAPFGEDIITPANSAIPFTNSSLGCQDAIKWLVVNNQSVSYYCNSTIRNSCQISCLPYLKLACTDDYFDCPKLGQRYCTGSLGSQPFKNVRISLRIQLCDCVASQLKFKHTYLICNALVCSLQVCKRTCFNCPGKFRLTSL